MMSRSVAAPLYKSFGPTPFIVFFCILLLPQFLILIAYFLQFLAQFIVRPPPPRILSHAAHHSPTYGTHMPPNSSKGPRLRSKSRHYAFQLFGQNRSKIPSKWIYFDRLMGTYVRY
jgi:hypothetical protein